MTLARPNPIFLSIPVEIRFQIYHLLLRQEELSIEIELEPLHSWAYHPDPSPPTPQSQYDPPNIGRFLQTCRQIREEALPLFYALVPLRITNLRSDTKDRCLAHFRTIKLVNPLIPWDDVSRARLFKVRHLTIDKGRVHWGNLGIFPAQPLDRPTCAHRGADNIVNSYMARLWVENMIVARNQMRRFALQADSEKDATKDLFDTMNFSVMIDEEYIVLPGRVPKTPTVFSLTLTSDHCFTLRYKYDDREYVVRQKRLVGGQVDFH